MRCQTGKRSGTRQRHMESTHLPNPEHQLSILYLLLGLAYVALMAPERGQWMMKLRACFETFGWNDYSCANLAGVSGGQLKEMLWSVLCRCVENDSAVDLDSKPKLSMLSSVCASGFDGRCWKVREKSHRKVLMMLRGGTAPFQIEIGRWKGIPRKERMSS